MRNKHRYSKLLRRARASMPLQQRRRFGRQFRRMKPQWRAVNVGMLLVYEAITRLR